MSLSKSNFAVLASILGITAFASSVNCLNAAAWADSGPRLVCTRKSALCDQILKAAKAAYTSNATLVEDGYEAVQKAKVGLVVSPSAESSDPPRLWCDNKFVDSKVFAPKEAASNETASNDEPAADTMHGLYWQKTINKGGRFVVSQRPMNWKGDWYGLYLLDGKITDNEVVKFIAKNTGDRQGESQKISSATIIYDNFWHAPWLFRNEKSGEFAGVDVRADWLGGKARAMPDWAIYACGGGKKAVRIGTIKFTTARTGLELLPKGALHDLAKLLDDMVGHPAPGSEGTMNQTARLRDDADSAWTALAARPWAMPKPPLSKAETDKSLLEWSKDNRTNKSKYTRMRGLYPQALSQLKSYYQVSLHKSAKDAGRLADEALASAYCSNFKF